ncbi:pyruvate kinase [Candidatus Saccharibacteria bacterium]|nr:pyruvate kinase [Candidatus Saccharibacteria bacterium]
MSVLFKRTKILATVGPAVNSYEQLLAMSQAGVNGFRLNFSHGDYAEREQQIAWIRETTAETGKPVAVLQDLQGPKIRLGKLKDDMRVDVMAGDEIVLDSAVEHDGGTTLPVQYNLAEKVQIGQPVYIFDGKIKTTMIEKVSETAIKLRVENSGTLMSKKGINLPDTDFGGDILTPKDIKDLEFGATQDIDFVALSFVQNASDIHNLRQMLVANGSSAQIIAKIETKAAILDSALEEIVRASDGVMVARGDLAVEAGAEVVPIVQRRIIALCRRYNKLSIVATQMMASMVDSPEPTRAEVSDVANAVILGADTVMLSDETANGSYPIETVKAMKKVILYTQDHAEVAHINEAVEGKNRQRDAISHAIVDLARDLHVTAIIAETKTGATAAAVAGNRPNLPIVAVTSEPRAAQQLALSYATKSFIRPDGENIGESLASELKESGYFGDTSEVTVAVMSGREPGVSGGTDTIRIRKY